MQEAVMNETRRDGGGDRRRPEPVVLINVFTPKPGKLDEFVALQAAELRRLTEATPPHGWRGSRLHRAVDGNMVVMVTMFDTIQDHRNWLSGDRFADHVERIMPLLERASPGYFEIVEEAGQF